MSCTQGIDWLSRGSAGPPVTAPGESGSSGVPLVCPSAPGEALGTPALLTEGLVLSNSNPSLAA